MPRSLVFSLDGNAVSAAIEKVDRKKVYGWIDKKAFDRNGNECYMGSLSDDGMSIFGKDSFELGYVDETGEWVEKTTLKVVDEEGNDKEKIESSFKAEIPLDTVVSIDEYLLHSAKSVYYLTGEEVDQLLAKVKTTDGIISFPFNYTASYDPDPAFLIESGDELFMVIGQEAGVGFVGLEEKAELPTEDEIEEEEGDDDAFDFGMM